MTKHRKALLDYQANITSQNGEDGITEQIFKTIRPKNKFCVDIGAWDGKHLSNVWSLLKTKNWHGVLVEADKNKYAQLTKNYLGDLKVQCINRLANFEGEDTFDNILSKTSAPKDFDLLSIDIDGNDYHLWNSITEYYPRCVIIEFNPSIPNHIDFIQQRDMNLSQGSSLKSLVSLGRRKGYELVATTVCNAFFVQSKLFHLFKIKDNSPEVLNKDSSCHTNLFQLFDGTLVLKGCRNLIWVPGWKIKAEKEKLSQVSDTGPREQTRFIPGSGSLGSFAGDKHLRNEIEQLVKKFKIKTIIETGTYFGETTKEFSKMVNSVYSIELNQKNYNRAKENLKGLKNVNLILGDSSKVLDELSVHIDGPVLFFLDAHWEDYWPIINELKAIAKFKQSEQSVIVVHDFYVPNTDLGYDSYYLGGSFLKFIKSEVINKLSYKIFQKDLFKKQRLDREYIWPMILNINPYFKYYYNNQAEGYRRGVIFIHPSFFQPPKQIPPNLLGEYSMNGKAEVVYHYFNDAYENSDPIVYSRKSIDDLIECAKLKKLGYYKKTDYWLYNALEKYNIKNKSVAIMGSVSPWYEAICLNYGGNPTIIDYNRIISEDTRVKTLTCEEYKKNPKKFDFAFSISSFEHDGLGRYGDPLDPHGDLNAMKKMKSLLKPKGILFLSVPLGKDKLVWNAHRIYGKNRLPLLLEGWKILDVLGFQKSRLEFPNDNPYNAYQPIFVLKNTHGKTK